MDRYETVALWATVAIGTAALACFVWNVTVTEAEPSDPPPEGLPSGGDGRSLAELALAPEANANNIGVRLASEGKFDQAVESFRYAVRTDPGYLPGHKNLLAALVESRRWPEALAAAREAEDVHPLGKYLKAADSRQLSADSQLQTANARSQTGPSAEATEGPGDAATDVGGPRLKPQASGLKPAARMQVPDDPEIRAALYDERDFIANCARAYLGNGLLEEAQARYLLHIQLCPNEVKGYNGLAELALRRKKPEDAVRLFAISLRTYGDQPDVVAHLQEIAAKGDEQLAAKVQWVLANYLEPKRQRPEMPAGVAPLKLPSQHARDWELPIRNPEPMVALPTAPIPELPQAPVPHVPTP